MRVNKKTSIITPPTKTSPWGDVIILQSSLSHLIIDACPTQREGSNKYNGSLIAWHEWSLEYQCEWTVTPAACFTGQSPLGLSRFTTRSSVRVALLLPVGCWFINIWKNRTKTELLRTLIRLHKHMCSYKWINSTLITVSHTIGF